MSSGQPASLTGTASGTVTTGVRNAAEDMLAALEEIRIAAENNTVLIPAEVAKVCRAAIAKATGAA